MVRSYDCVQSILERIVMCTCCRSDVTGCWFWLCFPLRYSQWPPGDGQLADGLCGGTEHGCNGHGEHWHVIKLHVHGSTFLISSSSTAAWTCFNANCTAVCISLHISSSEKAPSWPSDIDFILSKPEKSSDKLSPRVDKRTFRAFLSVLLSAAT